MEVKKQGNLPGDRPFFLSEKPRKYEASDIDGYLRADDSYATQDMIDSGKDTTREDAIRQLARNEGIQYPEGDLEDLLLQLKERKKKKTMPYEGRVSRPGL